MSQDVVSSDKLILVKPKSRLLIVLLWALLAACIGILAYSVFLLYPYVATGINSYAEYLNFKWLKQPRLVEIFLQLSLAVWLLIAIVYFAAWLFGRAVRKLRGKNWRVVKKDKRKHFFPMILPFLKFSCLFLAAVWLFVVLQYPLQFMILN